MYETVIMQIPDVNDRRIIRSSLATLVRIFYTDRTLSPYRNVSSCLIICFCRSKLSNREQALCAQRKKDTTARLALHTSQELTSHVRVGKIVSR